MFLRKVFEAMRRDELKDLRAEVGRLHEIVNTLLVESAKQQEEINTLKEKQTYVNEDGEHVSMAQVINEYLYGAKEGEA